MEQSLGSREIRECDIMKVDITELRVYKHPFPEVLGDQRVCDIMEVDVTELRAYEHPFPKVSGD